MNPEGYHPGPYVPPYRNPQTNAELSGKEVSSEFPVEALQDIICTLLASGRAMSCKIDIAGCLAAVVIDIPEGKCTVNDDGSQLSQS